jgi:hypothetical protein
MSCCSAVRTAHIAGRINRAPVLVDLIVNVGASGTTTAAHQCQHLALADNVTDFYQVFLIVCITGGITATVADFTISP